jgi:hypothetical protein
VRIKVDRLGRQQLADGIMLIGDRPVDRAISALVGVATNSDFSGKKSEPVKKRFLSSSSDISVRKLRFSNLPQQIRKS